MHDHQHAHEHEHEHGDGGHVHSDIRSDSLVLADAVKLDDLTRWMAFVREKFGAALLRCKGIVWVSDFGCPVILQGVQGQFAELERLPGWPDADHRSRIVCISEKLTSETVLASADVLRSQPAAAAGAFA